MGADRDGAIGRAMDGIMDGAIGRVMDGVMDGAIGRAMDRAERVRCHPALQSLPCILETPQENLSGYKREIELLRKEWEKHYGNEGD